MPNGSDTTSRLQELAALGILVAAIGTGWYLRPETPWGLHVVIFNVGQADAIAIVSADGKACVIDAGHGATAAGAIASFLKNEQENKVGVITTAKLGFVTHYDRDHMGGIDDLIEEEGITFNAMYDQGPSLKRSGKPNYEQYLAAVGDPNDNMEDDDPDSGRPFIRKEARVGLRWTLGDATIKCLSARGDTKGSAHDIDLDPSNKDIDENPGSIALLVQLGDFEFYTAGDQTSANWVGKPDTELSVVNSGVLGADNDIDVLKVNHHGSDTSTGTSFVQAIDPEVAVISSTLQGDGLPKMIAIKQLVDDHALVYITGNGRDEVTGTFTRSDEYEDDDDFNPPAGSVINNAGDVHIYVSDDGSRYSVVAAGEELEFSAVDSDNPH